MTPYGILSAADPVIAAMLLIVITMQKMTRDDISNLRDRMKRVESEHMGGSD